ncbi:exodeoxyribonuclease III [Devosia soli]|uniref:Exodeoxyribonuclease III n=1 Tax=Devosia soli TaxID=361041 RepID=A0A0F5LF75_9HYPH|nr:exodeoxyribonuclease III [Devosia soli]KKB80960.1 exodeoxyribonuclease III [Devosia soli]
MRIASYNINGINGRLGILIDWLDETQPDAVCLQELKCDDGKFPASALEKAGYAAIWQGQKSWNGVAILSRGREPVETQRGLAGEAEDGQSRYIEAAVNGVLIGCLYLPNGNPAPGPKFDYKLRWFERLRERGKALLASEAPVALVGDFNVMPTERDVYAPDRWRDDALFRPEVRKAFGEMIKDGWTDAVRNLHPDENIYTFWKYWRQSFERDAGLRIDHFLLSPTLLPRLTESGVDRHIRALEGTSDHAPVWIEIADAG